MTNYTIRKVISLLRRAQEFARDKLEAEPQVQVLECALSVHFQRLRALVLGEQVEELGDEDASALGQAFLVQLEAGSFFGWPLCQIEALFFLSNR